MKTKTIIYGLSGAGLIGVTTSTVVACAAFIPTFDNLPTFSNTLSGTGSSSVAPLIKGNLENDFGGRLTYTSTGSGQGFESQSGPSPYSGFGATSSKKAPENDVWENSNIRTATWAIDAISIALNLPDEIDTIEAPIIYGEELFKLYDNDSTTTTTWGDLLSNETPDSTNLDQEVLALGRNGGKSASGTTDGFVSKLDTFGEEDNIDEDHRLISARQLTLEPNSAALDSLKTQNGSLTYLSLGFILNNIEEGLAEAATIISSVDDSLLWVPTIENAVIGEYEWVRPFNIIYDVTNSDAVIFTNFLLGTDYQNYVRERGFVSLSDDQITFQTSLLEGQNVSLETTDAEILRIVDRTSNTSISFGLNL